MSYYPGLILDALRHVVHPGKGVDIVTLDMVEDDIKIEGNRVSFSLLFDRPNDPMISSIKNACVKAIKLHVGDEVLVDGNIHVKVKPRQVRQAPVLLPGVENIVAVASGKGGVGKSTVACNIAVSLAKKGYRVGLLDADIFGPSVPKMFATEDSRPDIVKIGGKDQVVPIEKYGVKLLSIGYFVNPNEALVWRGAMATNALKQFIADTAWGELDYLLIDLPPGTSDIHLTLVQTIPVTGAIIVSTPQEVALADARKGISMFQGDKIDVPVLGLVENMAWFTPAELPGNKYYIFGKDGCKLLAGELGLPLLGEIPIVQGIREGGDNGIPPALLDNTIEAIAFEKLAEALTRSVEARKLNLAPTKVVEIKKQ